MKQSVLVVDDVIGNIDVLESILNDQYDVKAATNGLLAIRIAEKLQPDIILLDIMMPDMDGYEVCKVLKSNPLTSNIPIIFVTAMSEEKDEEKGFKIGAIDYITKPVSPIIVRARVKTHLSLSNQQRELDIQVKEKTKQLQLSRVDLVRRLGKAAEFKDKETGFHVERVSKYCKVIALEYGLPLNEAEMIELAAPMHDVGKIGIADNILRKPGPLDKDEWESMKTHSTIGGEILGTHTDALLSVASVIALEHHERWNGNGYPNGKKQEEIHLFSRIVALADVFDALTSVRPYKEAWSVEDAVKLVKEERGQHFDPKVVDAFIAGFDQIMEIKNDHIDL